MDTDGQGFTVWFTGLSGAGKTTIANIVARDLRGRGKKVEVLDGDVVRTELSAGLGFSREDRDANIRRIGWVCELLNRNDVIAVVAAISPYRATRDEVRSRLGRFVEVYVEAPLEVVAARDPKGLYRRAQAGEVPSMTGVDDPYEPPVDPDVTCHTDGHETPEESAARVVAKLGERGYVAAEGEAVADSAYTADEEAEVTDRLRDLGYL
ncbi:MAG TPA: adenylyl-sulfate kinase [Candidatus Limnocylindria bacterium]|nr:adenylyl-sulfate kinase [Candidatus Limnocylindria bacterium]